MVELGFSASAPVVASNRSVLHGRPLVSPRSIRTTSSIKARRQRGAVIVAVNSLIETISRRGLLNNVITAAFFGAALYVFFTPVKSFARTAAPVATAPDGLRAPSEATVTSKVFFDVSIGGVPAGRIVLGMFSLLFFFLLIAVYAKQFFF